jgi:hypothetical protein
METEGAYIGAIIKMEEYVKRKEDPLIQIVRTRQHSTNSTPFKTVNNSRALHSPPLSLG